MVNYKQTMIRLEKLKILGGFIEIVGIGWYGNKAQKNMNYRQKAERN